MLRLVREGDLASQPAKDAADTALVQAGTIRHLAQRQTRSAQPKDVVVLRIAVRQQVVPDRIGLRMLAGSRLGADRLARKLGQRLLTTGLRQDLTGAVAEPVLD